LTGEAVPIPTDYRCRFWKIRGAFNTCENDLFLWKGFFFGTGEEKRANGSN
jgi:hypothetical protein